MYSNMQVHVICCQSRSTLIIRTSLHIDDTCIVQYPLLAPVECITSCVISYGLYIRNYVLLDVATEDVICGGVCVCLVTYALVCDYSWFALRMLCNFY